jgi:K+/H+ antiporter YhaU regulatory subunit KhtT
MGANTLFNLLRGADHLLLAEGVNVFPSEVPPGMAGRPLAELHVRSVTGCGIIAVESGGERTVNLGPDFRLPASGRIFLVGTIEAEERFLKEFQPPRRRRRRAA